MKILCHFIHCKWIHVTDVIVGYNQYNQPMHIGLWQCMRCGDLSKGQCGSGPAEDEDKA